MAEIRGEPVTGWRRWARWVPRAAVAVAAGVVVVALVAHGRPSRPSYADAATTPSAADDLNGGGATDVAARLRTCLAAGGTRAVAGCLAQDRLAIVRGRVTGFDGRNLTLHGPTGPITIAIGPLTVWKAPNATDRTARGDQVVVVERAGTAVLVQGEAGT